LHTAPPVHLDRLCVIMTSALKAKLFGSGKRCDKSQALREQLNNISLKERQCLSTNQIRLSEMIGEGGFAKVYRCELDGQRAVAKVIDASKLNEEMTYLLTNECTIWARLAHRHIVSFYGMATTPAAVLLVCEHLPGGALQDRLKRKRDKKDPPPEPLELVTQLQQIASGMEYLHGLDPPVLHRDLKSANVLISEEDGGSTRLAIADFGLARYQATSGKKMTAETGSYRWMAPEVIRHEEYDMACDVYSFAILTWEMLTYRVPFDNMMPVEAAFAVAREAKRPPIPSQWAQLPIAEMLRACWHQQPHKRPPFAAICAALAEEVDILKSAGGDGLSKDLPVGDLSIADGGAPDSLHE